MDQYIEFVTNNLLLFAALFAVFVMLLKAEFEHQTSKSSQLTPAQATRLLNNSGEESLILDIRAQTEFTAGHIKKALNIPLAELKSSLDKVEKYKAKPILIYCNSGNTSLKAVRILQGAGFTDINNLSGGVAGWKEASLPLAKN